MTDARKDAEPILRDYAKLWNERQYERIPDVLAEDYVMHDPPIPEEGVPGPRGEAHGRKGAEQYMRMIESGFPQWEWSIHDVIAREGDIMYEGEITMVHEGEWLGIPPTGREATFPEMGRVLHQDGQVTVHRIYFDRRDILQQLGLIE